MRSFLFIFGLLAQMAYAGTTSQFRCEAALIPASPLNTARLQLRSIEPSDIPALVRGHDDSQMLASLGINLNTFRRALNFATIGQSGPILRSSLTILHKGQIIGLISLTEVTRDRVFFNQHPKPTKSFWVEVGYSIHPQYWNQGFASEALAAAIDFAFSQLHVAGIFAHAYKGNPASIRVLANAGFRQYDQLERGMLFALPATEGL